MRVRVERGIYGRATKDGATRYEVAYLDTAGRQRWRTVAKLHEARKLRADLVSKVGRGEVIPSTTATFAELAEEWYAAKAARVRARTADYYRQALDHVLLPRFGRLRIAAIDADAVSRLTRDLEREGLHAIDPERPVRPLGCSSVVNYLKPLQGVCALAVRRRLIPASPFSVLTDDDRPMRAEREKPHEWSEDDVEALLAASSRLAGQRESKYDYTPLLRLVATLGLRKGEALGLRWEDFDREAGVLHVRRQWGPQGVYGPTKTEAGVRRIALPAGLRDDLIALRLSSDFSLDEHPLFVSSIRCSCRFRGRRSGIATCRGVALSLPVIWRGCRRR
ncbi:MAG: hypothetical protein H0X39_16475 [Actinobacteria bacterium]|nr:hypothetical protein [Actinomycetota bacterium]